MCSLLSFVKKHMLSLSKSPTLIDLSKRMEVCKSIMLIILSLICSLLRASYSRRFYSFCSLFRNFLMFILHLCKFCCFTFSHLQFFFGLWPGFSILFVFFIRSSGLSQLLCCSIFSDTLWWQSCSLGTFS